MKLTKDLDSSSYVRGVPYSVGIIEHMKPGFLKAPSSCFPVRNFHTETPPQDLKAENVAPIHQLPQGIMLTYAQVVKSVARQIPQLSSSLIPCAQAIGKAIVSTSNMPSCLPTPKSPQVWQNSSKLSNHIQNSRCPWRSANQRHSTIKSVSKVPEISIVIGPSKMVNCSNGRNSLYRGAHQTSQHKQFISRNPGQSYYLPPGSYPVNNLRDPRHAQVLKGDNDQNSCSTKQDSQKYTVNKQHSDRSNTPLDIRNRCEKPKWPQRRKGKFWTTSPRVLNSNWRIPCSETQKSEVVDVKSKLEPTVVKDMIKNQEMKVKNESIPVVMSPDDRSRKFSESSMTSDDSWIVFEREPGCSYESEVSSQDSDSESETESELESDTSESDSSDDDDGTSIQVDSGNFTDCTDSDVESPILQVGGGRRVSLPPVHPVPPARHHSFSKSSSNSSENDLTDSDDDFIVFQSDSEDEFDGGHKSNEIDSSDSKEPRKNAKNVRFAPEEEICYLWDDDDYRGARVGEWEEMVRDRIRFRSRITSTAEVLAPILSPLHRQKIRETRYSSP